MGLIRQMLRNLAQLAIKDADCLIKHFSTNVADLLYILLIIFSGDERCEPATLLNKYLMWLSVSFLLINCVKFLSICLMSRKTRRKLRVFSLCYIVLLIYIEYAYGYLCCIFVIFTYFNLRSIPTGIIRCMFIMLLQC